MPIHEQIATCAGQYSRWKRLALDAQTLPAMKECLNKALFWMELQSSFVALWGVERTMGNDPSVKRKLILAKTNLSRKLADYAQKTLDELNWGR
ncbi:MAG: hypothetical protein ABIA12_02850 [Candidatus Aenigmatarchaeota archaeon]